MGEEAGDELVGELAESLVNEWLQGCEGSRVAGELVGPEGLLGSKVGMDLLKSLVGGGDVRPALGVESDAHGKAFQIKGRCLE